MPIHDWELVDASIFYSFHVSWTVELCRSLNGGLLPPNYYALTETMGHPGPSLFQTFQQPPNESIIVDEPSGGVDREMVPPQTHFHARAEEDIYAANAKTVVIRHQSNHRVISAVMIVSPGNKNNRHGLRSFVEKVVAALRAGIHLLIVDLFPPGPCDPQGIFKAVWDELIDNDFTLPEDKPLTVVAYSANEFPEAFIEPVAVGDCLSDMPLFLTPDVYILTPLEATYGSAWEAFPSFWREVLENTPHLKQP
ncbi:MAG TPA: DUF4058 family protein [Gemmataceae bacterium]|nr:DUF4058 family protein [Gemmataceae bacterium]